MSSQFAFQNQSATFDVTTDGTTLTAAAQVVSFADPVSSQPATQATGLTRCPPQVRCVNTSDGVVYISFTSGLRTAAVPGTDPSKEFPLAAGEDRVFSLTQFPQESQNPSVNMTLQINTIAVGTSAVINVTFGEGR
jgi:hypothetical protein